jgi:hypothetical protein
MRFFLVNEQGQIHIRNEELVSVTFQDDQEFFKYTGEMLPYSGPITYEPPLFFSHGWKGENKKPTKQDTIVFEEFIKNVPLYLGRKNDKFYGLEPEEVFSLAKEERKREIKVKRKEYEGAGTTYQGFTIDTSLENIMLLDYLIDKIRRNKLNETFLLCEEGYLKLEKKNIDAIEALVLQHVQEAILLEKAEWEDEESRV